MTLDEAMAALESAGDERFRKTWARHGAPPPVFGVPYAHLYKLQKGIGEAAARFDVAGPVTIELVDEPTGEIMATVHAKPAS